jgi:hypothetical protein
MAGVVNVWEGSIAELPPDRFGRLLHLMGRTPALLFELGSFLFGGRDRFSWIEQANIY